MTLLHARRRLAAMLLVAIVEIGLIIAPLWSSHASAAFTGCGSDPVVSLSNGAQLDLSAYISDDISNVRQVAYVLHAPAGTQLVNIVNTDGAMGLKEVFQIYTDNQTDTYTADTTVSTAQGRVAVTANMDLVSPLGLTVGSGSAAGMSQQDLSIQIVEAY